MEEKNFEYILRCTRATDACMNGYATVMDALKKQMRINRRQRMLNFLAFNFGALCFIRIGDLIKVVTEHNKKLKELGAREEEKKKGE